jgi:hypothetical protein
VANGRTNISEFLTSPVEQLDHLHMPIPWLDGDETLPRVTLFRTADLMEIVLSFIDLTIEQRPEGPILRRSDGANEGYLCAHFRGQHLHEEAFFESSGVDVQTPGTPRAKGAEDPDHTTPRKGGETVTPPPVRTRIAGRSRLVFRVTDEHIPFTSAGLLSALRMLPLSVAPHAVQHGGDLIILGLQGVLRPLPRVLAIEDGLRLSGAVQTAGRTLQAAAVMRVRFGDAAAAEVLTAAHSAGGTFELDRAVAEELGARRGGPGMVIDLRPPPPREPSATETAVEIPWRLQLSPHEDAGFTHTIRPATSATGRVELWHTRLGTRILTGVDDALRDTRTVRAVWARDFTETPGFTFHTTPPTGAAAATEFPDAGQVNDIPRWRSPLNSRDRMMLVHESSNFRLRRSDGARYVPPSVKVDRLMLSALGGWLTSTFQTTPPRGATTIEEWVHRAALGRDSYVKVVYAGFLLPFGHRASLVKVTERKVKSGIAYLFQRMFVVVREPLRSYGATGDPMFDRAMPFTTVQILTDSTPDIDPPDDLSKDANAVAGYMFTPTVGGNAFSFRMLGVDLVGRLVEFDGPLVFAEYDHNAVPDTVQRTINAFQTQIPAFHLRGQKVAYAPSVEPDDTSLATATMRFNIGAPNGIFSLRPDQAQPRWEPKLEDCNAVVPAMSVLAGANAGVTVRYPEQYLKSQFTDNPADVYLQLASPAALDFATQSDRSGGFVAPSIDVTALSRTLGPMGGPPAALFPGSPGAVPFDIKKFFASSAKLFGLVTLGDLLAGGLDTAALPRFVAQSFNAATMLTNNLEQLQALSARLAATMPGGPVAAQLQGATTTAAAAINALAALVPASGAPPIDVRRTAAVTALTQMTAQLPSLLGAVATEPGLLRADQEALSTIINRLSDQLATNVDQIDTVVDLAARAAVGEILPETMRGRLDWTTDIQSWPPADPNPIFAPTGGTGKLIVAVDIQAPTCPGGEPSALVSCALSPFELRLIGEGAFITLSFEKMEFSAVPGRKTDVNVELGEIKFGGPLQFVETLRSIIPLDGFSDPPYLDVSPSGIRSGFDLPIPNVAMGIFALTNINLSAAFEVPFIGESIAVRFGFSTRESPFRLQIALFAGGGFFGIVITPKEVRELEAALEFGAAVALDFGVASGSVSVMAGIYFRLRTVDGNTSAYLTGYFRARGEVDVLGLITACIEIYLELTYETASGKAVGRASISVEVSVCMLSFSVSIEVEKKFAGSAGDPTFAQVMGRHPTLPASPRPWDEYCDAFAD